MHHVVNTDIHFQVNSRSNISDNPVSTLQPAIKTRGNSLEACWNEYTDRIIYRDGTTSHDSKSIVSLAPSNPLRPLHQPLHPFKPRLERLPTNLNLGRKSIKSMPRPQPDMELRRNAITPQPIRKIHVLVTKHIRLAHIQIRRRETRQIRRRRRNRIDTLALPVLSQRKVQRVRCILLRPGLHVAELLQRRRGRLV